MRLVFPPEDRVEQLDAPGDTVPLVLP